MKRTNDDDEKNGQIRRPSITLLEDVPTPKDAFGAHQRLADTIADLIESEQGGKAVALEGGWGSGKSSVVEMLSKKLADRTKGTTRVLVFDAWSHEGDPLRRVFLEQLMTYCRTDLDSSRTEHWDNRTRTEIVGKSRETDQTSVPVLRSPWPLAALALLTLFPVALAIVAGLFRRNQLDQYEQSILIVALFVALCVPGLMLVLFAYCVQWPLLTKAKKKLSDKFEWINPPRQQKKKLADAGRMISLYAKKIDETTSTTTHETLGPTSIEFQRFFCDLLAEYLAQPDRKLVLVLDNLDRVPTETARSLWSTLRVFAECCENKENESWAGRVWFVVPYDPASARRLWDDGLQSEFEHENEPDDANAPSVPKLSAAFLDKTFQIRFDVPPLLLEDWKDYLCELVFTALGDTASDETEVHKVYLLSRYLAEQKRRPPTPRHLKLYVNDVGALCRRFDGKFPVSHMALYTILRRQGRDVRAWLLNAKEEHELFEQKLNDDDFMLSLCAMVFGTTDRERARDLLLRSPIEAALANGKSDDLNQLSKVHGFWPVMEIVCGESASTFGTEDARVVNSLAAVESSDLLTSTQQETAALKRFLESLVAEAKWNKLDKNTSEGIAIAHRLGLAHSIVQAALGRLASLTSKEDLSELDVDEWISGMQWIATECSSEDLERSFDAQVTLTASDDSTKLLSKLGSLDPSSRRNVASMIKVSGSAGELVDGIAPAPTVEFTRANADAIRGLISIPSSGISVESTSNAVAARLRNEEELTKPEIDRHVNVLVDLESRFGHIEAIQKLAEDAILFRRIKNCEKKLDSRPVGELFRWSIRFYSFSKRPSAPTNAPEGYDLAAKIATNPAEYEIAVKPVLNQLTTGDSNYLLNSILCEVNVIPQFVGHVIDALRKRDELGLVLGPNCYVNRVPDIETHCSAKANPGIDEFTDELLQTEWFVENLSKLKPTDDNLPGIIRLTNRDALSKNVTFRDTICEFLNQITSDDWVKSIKSQDDRYQLLVAVRRQIGDFTLGEAASEGLESILNETIDGETAINPVPDDWSVVLDAIPENQRMTRASRVVESSDAPGKLLWKAIPLCYEPLKSAALGHSEESFLRNALIPILQEGDDLAHEWLADVVVDSPAWWPNTPDHDKETLSQTLNDVFGSSSDDRKTILKKIAVALDIVLESPEPDASEATAEE
ncbi:P-loop NTPase fold protein [Planctomycetes bacterium K23_9]|uniref:KAP family P-loop domain protein n=1 Tax=Stieleria marina TaxID=1930275 RepID=A0A517NR91_9BACT|nr:KAP family P-loop domain protein [Planctomycetes bacterium K23_9]